MSTIARGRAAEELARRHLCRQGLQLIEQNFRCRVGELDLVMRDRQHLVFVEVRSRGSRRFGGAAASVTIRKQQRLIRAALAYLQQRRLDLPCRFDVVAIDGQGQIEWIRDAFQVPG